MLAFAVAAVAFARGKPISDPTQLFPGAVATPDRSVGVFTVPSGGVQAVRLATGAKVWTSGAATWPLDIVGDEVLAAVPDKSQPNAFDIVGLGLDDGSLRFVSDFVSLPSWAKPTLGYDEPSGYRFDLSTESFDNHTMLVRWSARAWDSGSRCDHKREVGAVQIDTQTGLISKPFLGAQPRVLSQNLLRDTKPDLAEPNSHIVGPETKTDDYTVYLSEGDQAQSDKRPLKVVAVDPESGKLLWDLPLGTRSCSRQPAETVATVNPKN